MNKETRSLDFRPLRARHSVRIARNTERGRG